MTYVKPEILKDWKESRDPIKNFKAKLINAGIAEEAEFTQIDADVLKEILEAIDEADKSPLPSPDRIYQGLFSQEGF